MSIAILGWGSILWDEKKYREFDRQRGEWQFDGPLLPLEFCRKARDRGNALTLVIDSQYGSHCQVSWCLSKRHNLEEALEDLRLREGTNKRTISHIHSAQMDLNQEPAATIKQWALKRKIDVVIWSGFRCNLRDFTVDAAIRHLERLPENSKKKAVEYIYRASPFIQTRLRTRLSQCSWFSMESKNLKLANTNIFDLVRKLEDETYTLMQENANPAFCLASNLPELYETFLQCLAAGRLIQPDNELFFSLQSLLNSMKTNAVTASLLIMRGHVYEYAIFNKRSIQLCALAKCVFESHINSAVLPHFLQIKETVQWNQHSIDSLVMKVLSSELFEQYRDICLSEQVSLLAGCSDIVKISKRNDSESSSSNEELPTSLSNLLIQTIDLHFQMLELLGTSFQAMTSFDRWFGEYLYFREELLSVKALNKLSPAVETQGSQSH